MTRSIVTAALLLLFSVQAAAASRVVIFPSSDGTLLTGTVYEPSARPAPAVVLVHMLGRSREDWNRVAEQLERSGLIVLAFDLRGHGRSSGAMGMLAAMVGDVRAAIAWVAARPGTRPGSIAVVGASVGATLAAIAAADDPSVQAVAMLSPSLDYRGLRIDAGVMRKLVARPMWMASSTHDPYALRTMKDLATGAAGREQRLTDAFGHGTNLLALDPDLERGLVDWLRRTLIF